MRTQPTLAVLAASLALSAPLAGQELFRLTVDPGGSTPIYDATGRHGLVAGGVADVDPGAPVVPGSVAATSVTAPDGANAALFEGGWLEITTSNPSFDGDLTLPVTGRRVISFWFKSPGNGEYAATGNADRMHALGFGTSVDNLDVDFGDSDGVPFVETACWTYWDGPGHHHVIDPDTDHDRSYYLDDQWHHYRLVRDGELITVSIDGTPLGSTSYAGQIHPNSANSFIGRASVFSSGGDPYPWFGYIASFTIIDDDSPPLLTCPSLVQVLDKKDGPPGSVVFYSVTASDDIDPAPALVCTPPSGSFFPRGTTLVTCTATDASGNQSVCQFPVVVQPTFKSKRF